MCIRTKNDRKKKKGGRVGNKKVEYDRELMKGLIKEIKLKRISNKRKPSKHTE